MTTETENDPRDFKIFPVEDKAPVADAPAEAPQVEEEPSDAPEPEVAAESDEPEQTPEEKAEKDQKSANRFTKQTRELRETKRALDELRAELERLKKPAEEPLTPIAKSDTVSPSGAPDPAKYQYGELDPQFMADMIDYRADQKLAQFREELTKEQERSTAQAAAQRELAELQEKAKTIGEQGKSKFKDFEETVINGLANDEIPMTEDLFKLVAETSVPADILYHLASDPDEAELLASLPLAKQALRIGRLEAKLSAPQPRRTPQAPVPVANARGSGSKAVVAPDADYLAYRKAYGNLT
jgi:hypothetical protein